jgi:hypothetical protein
MPVSGLIPPTPARPGATKPFAQIVAALLCDHEKHDQHEYRAGDC